MLGSDVVPFELYTTDIDRDPFPYYRTLREEHPCYWSQSGRIWILSRYDDVFNGAMDWKTYSSAKGNLIDEIPGRSGSTLGTTDPPRHDRRPPASLSPRPRPADGLRGPSAAARGPQAPAAPAHQGAPRA